jgi:hypothetical protein
MLKTDPILGPAARVANLFADEFNDTKRMGGPPEKQRFWWTQTVQSFLEQPVAEYSNTSMVPIVGDAR